MLSPRAGRSGQHGNAAGFDLGVSITAVFCLDKTVSPISRTSAPFRSCDIHLIAVYLNVYPEW